MAPASLQIEVPAEQMGQQLAACITQQTQHRFQGAQLVVKVRHDHTKSQNTSIVSKLCVSRSSGILGRVVHGKFKYTRGNIGTHRWPMIWKSRGETHAAK